MIAIIDTHALIWAGNSVERLSQSARIALNDPTNQFYVSAATAWEVATKVRIGKLPEAELLEATFLQSVQGAGYKFLPVSVEQGL